MKPVYRVVSDPFSVQLGIEDDIQNKLFGVSSLCDLSYIFPISARLDFGSKNRKRVVGESASVAGLMYLLCIRGRLLELIKRHDYSACFGSIAVAGQESANFEIYIPSVVECPVNDASQCVIASDGRIRIRRPEFAEGRGETPLLFTVPKAYEASGETFCSQVFLEEVVATGVGGLVFIRCDTGAEVKV